MQIEVLLGDIFEQQVDAIVNPAHPSLLAGSGLCGEIFKRAGKIQLENHCHSELRKINRNTLELGKAIITPAFNLSFKRIIHTAVPKFYQHGVDTLSDCYLNSILLAQKDNLQAIAFPALGIGINQIPVEISAQKLTEAINILPTVLDMRIVLVVRDEATKLAFSAALV